MGMLSTIVEKGSSVLALGKAKLMAGAVTFALAVSAVPALAEDAGGTGGGTGGTGSSAWQTAQSVAKAKFNVEEFAQGSYTTCAETIGSVAPYLIMLAVIGVAIAWVFKLIRQGKKN